MTSESLKQLCDGASVTTVVATVAGWLPDIAALLTIVWTGFRIHEAYLNSKIAKQKLKDTQ